MCYGSFLWWRWAHGRSKIFRVYCKGLLEVSSALSHPLVIGCKAREDLAGGILDRFIEDNLGKWLKAFGIERVKGISLCQVEGRKLSSLKLLTAEDSENHFQAEKCSIFQYFEAVWSSRSCNNTPSKHFSPPPSCFNNVTPSALPVFKTSASLPSCGL